MELGLVEPGVGRRQGIFKDTGLLSGGAFGNGHGGQHDGHGQANCFDPWKLDIHRKTPRKRFSLPIRPPLKIWDASVSISQHQQRRFIINISCYPAA
jgi:hypothetical protein